MLPRPALLFDLDGTLTDSRSGILNSIRYTLQELGHSVPSDDVLQKYIGPPLQMCFRDMLGTDDETEIEQAISIYRSRFSRKGLYENRLYDGIPEVLETLTSTGFTLYIATSKPLVYATRIADHFTIARYFKQIYGPDLKGMLSDKTTLLAHVLGQEDIQPSGAVMIGDRRHDMEGARHNGMQTLGVTYGYGTEDELRTAGADAVVHTPGEILSHLT